MNDDKIEVMVPEKVGDKTLTFYQADEEGTDKVVPTADLDKVYPSRYTNKDGIQCRQVPVGTKIMYRTLEYGEKRTMSVRHTGFVVADVGDYGRINWTGWAVEA